MRHTVCFISSYDMIYFIVPMGIFVLSLFVAVKAERHTTV